MQNSAPPSQAVTDLGLGSILTDQLSDEEEKRKKLLADSTDAQRTSLTSGGIMSPATMNLFGVGNPAAKIGNF